MLSPKFILLVVTGLLLLSAILSSCQGTRETSSPEERRDAPIVEPYKYRPKSNR